MLGKSPKLERGVRAQVWLQRRTEPKWKEPVERPAQGAWHRGGCQGWPWGSRGEAGGQWGSIPGFPGGDRDGLGWSVAGGSSGCGFRVIHWLES